jgi:hypothetical protein
MMEVASSSITSTMHVGDTSFSKDGIHVQASSCVGAPSAAVLPRLDDAPDIPTTLDDV